MKLLALAIALFLAPQDEKITLKFNPRKGDKLVKTQKLEIQLKCSVETGGETQEIEFEQRNSLKRVNEYVEVADGQVTRMIIDCTEDFEEHKRPPTMEWVRTDQPMHGRKVTVFKRDGELVREGAEGLKEKDLKKIDLVNFEWKLLPPKPLAVGESWELKGEEVQQFFGTDQALKDATLKMKLTEVKEIDKRRCAMISGTVEMKGKAPNDIDMGAKMDIEVVVWIERGYVLSAKGKGKVTMKGENDRFKLSGEGPITIELTNKVE